MAGKVCSFEKEHGVRVPRNKFVDDAIETAIKAEQKEGMVYANAAAGATNYQVKDLLTWLATEEEKHAETLTNLKNCLQSAGRWVEGAHEIKDRLPMPVVPRGEKQAVSKDEIRVLLEAMKVEKKSIAYYKDLAGKAKHAGARTFFNKLADYEEEHYSQLDALFDELSKLEQSTQTI